MLFDPRGHEPLADAAWDAAKVGAAIREIARDADEALRKGEWWPLHPLDDDGETPDAIHGVYFGAAGVLWALDHVAVAGLHDPATTSPDWRPRCSTAIGAGPSSALPRPACS